MGKIMKIKFLRLNFFMLFAFGIVSLGFSHTFKTITSHTYVKGNLVNNVSFDNNYINRNEEFGTVFHSASPEHVTFKGIDPNKQIDAYAYELTFNLIGYVQSQSGGRWTTQKFIKDNVVISITPVNEPF
jgi:hypothetical protein